MASGVHGPHTEPAATGTAAAGCIPSVPFPSCNYSPPGSLQCAPEARMETQSGGGCCGDMGSDCSEARLRSAPSEVGRSRATTSASSPLAVESELRDGALEAVSSWPSSAVTQQQAFVRCMCEGRNLVRYCPQVIPESAGPSRCPTSMCKCLSGEHKQTLSED